jgi:hypothetical protein
MGLRRLKNAGGVKLERRNKTIDLQKEMIGNRFGAVIIREQPPEGEVQVICFRLEEAVDRASNRQKGRSSLEKREINVPWSGAEKGVPISRGPAEDIVDASQVTERASEVTQPRINARSEIQITPPTNRKRPGVK